MKMYVYSRQWRSALLAVLLGRPKQVCSLASSDSQRQQVASMCVAVRAPAHCLRGVSIFFSAPMLKG